MYWMKLSPINAGPVTTFVRTELRGIKLRLPVYQRAEVLRRRLPVPVIARGFRSRIRFSPNVSPVRKRRADRA